MNDEIEIRQARVSDAKELLDIYSYYVEKTAISFETEVPSVGEFETRIKKTLSRYPYIAACKDGEILGYAYLSPFVGRKAYDWSAETTIYLKADKRNMGIGKRLYEVLESIAVRQNITNLYSCIGYPNTDDKYLNKNSVKFHEHMGYRLVGEFKNCGHKFGKWYSMVWMEKIIAAHADIGEVIPFNEMMLRSI